MTDKVSDLLKELERPERPQRPLRAPVQEYRPQAKEHYANRGRGDLFSLPSDRLFIVVGTNSGVYPTNRKDVIRFALKEVSVFEHDPNKVFSLDPEQNECALVGRADHINAIRKAQGMEYANLEDGEQTVWLGKREDYQSIKAAGVDRVSMKLFRDLNIQHELRLIQKRMINYNNQRDFIEPDDRVVRLNKTSSMIDRLNEIVSQDNFFYVPWMSRAEVTGRLELYRGTILAELEEVNE